MAKAKKFGTFGGVFTPSILTILGVIMYMRMPMIAGEAGLVGSLGIIFIAHLISVTTGLSVSSIATDKKVKEGGTYYIISRSLGLPIGGTLGLALFVGLSFSVSLYLIGFSESFLNYLGLPMDVTHIRIVGSIILLVVTIITFISTSLAIKAQYLIMTAIGLSLLSIFLGRHDFAPEAPNFFGSGSGIPLMVLFGIFFPAVTGFEAGVSMSGDLKDPKKSIPFGTISAISIGLIVYVLLAFFFAYTVDGKMLATDPRALFKIALVPQLVIAGIWGATLSSALGSILAAPRILQSTAIDRITPRIFARGSGASKEPRNALLLTFLIAEAGILIGELDVIARIVSIFFITTYGFLNLSAAFESLTSADFRPSFRTPAWVSMIGSLACIIVMVQLDFLAMISAVVILGLLFLFLKRKQLVLESGDAWSSVWFSLVWTGIRKLNKTVMHNRNWRPNIIVFSGPDKERPHIIEFARAFSGRFGVFSAFEMIESDEAALIKDQRYFASSGKDADFLIHQHRCRNVYDGMDEISRVYGFSGIEPNMVLMGWSKREHNKKPFLNLIRNLHSSDFNTAFLCYNALKKFGDKKSIDFWWSGKGSNLAFSVSLMRHFTASGEWRDANIRLLVINNSRVSPENIYSRLQEFLNQYRINMEIRIISNYYEKLPSHELICRESVATDLTILDFPGNQLRHPEELYDRVNTLSGNLGTFLLINSSSRFEAFDLIDNELSDGKNEPGTREMDLQELQPSKYLVINEAVSKADAIGLKTLEQFNKKAVEPVYAEYEQAGNEVRNAVNNVISQLLKLEELDDTYRRRKALIKIKNGFYYQINRVFTELTANRLIVQQKSLEGGIEWYTGQLEKNLLNLPGRIEINYEKNDLTLKKNDPLGLKWFKLRRRLLHPFSQETIPGKLNYKNIAGYYLRDTRHQFLADFLKRIQSDLYSSLSEMRALIILIDDMLDHFMEKSGNGDLFMQLVGKNINEAEAMMLKSGNEGIGRRTKAYHQLRSEFRKNLQLMSNDMAKADINFRIKRKRRKRRFYKELIRSNNGFPATWYEQTINHVSGISMDIFLQACRTRIKDKAHELNLRIIQLLEKGYGAALKKVRAAIQDYNPEKHKIPAMEIGVQNFNDKITLLRDFEIFGEEVLKLSDTLPENMIIEAGQPQEKHRGSETNAREVPLRKIVRFYLESQFIGATHDNLKKVVQQLRNSVFSIQDLLSLTRFSLDNIPEDLPDRKEQISMIVNPACSKIEAEEEKVAETVKNIRLMIEHSLQEVFTRLSSYRMPVTMNDYSHIIREDQGRKVKNAVFRNIDNLKDFYRHALAWILYSKSEGVLLAKTIIEPGEQPSVNEKILAMVERIRPDEKVVNKLPQYYRNLFSGRSSISDDFWIIRENDEGAFKKVLQRYRAGYYGGIMILGERNSGKTAFCMNQGHTTFKKETVYHIFPPASGSVSVSDFVSTMQRVTKENGSPEEIINRIPRGSVMMLHDLELWWERSMEGWDVVRLLIKLINENSPKLLFVINMNPVAFTLINKLLNLQDSLIGVIRLKPFDALDIKEMIMLRHHSSGMKFLLNGKGEDALSEIKLAKLFNRYFDYSGGNPGAALKAWIANISGVEGQTIHIRMPVVPDAGVLLEIEEEWKVLLIAMMLHKRLSYERVKNILDADDEHTVSILGSMMRMGLVEERNEGLYNVSDLTGPHLITLFKQEGLI